MPELFILMLIWLCIFTLVSVSDAHPYGAYFLFQQEWIFFSRVSKNTGMEIMILQKLLADRDICIHYDVEDFEEKVTFGARC